MSRKVWPLLLISALILAAAILPAAAATKDYSADRYDVVWDVQEDGSLLITETVVFRFEGGPFTFVYRELPLDYSDGIVDIRATLDGAPMPAGAAAGQVELTGRDPIKVTWHFGPTSDATHTYGLSYRALGVVRQEADADLLTWHALPTEYEYRIARASLTVNYPAGLTLLSAPEVRRGRAEVNATPGRVLFTTANLSSDSDLLVALRFVPGSLITAPPEWQARANRARQAAPAWVAGAAGILLAGVAGLGASAARWRRERRPKSSGFRPSTPPGELAPAFAGALTATGGQIGWSHALASLFDLAQRGVLRIDEAERKRFRPRDFILERIAQPPDLLPHEQGLLNLLFGFKWYGADAVRLSDLSKRASSQLDLFSKPLEDELVAAGLFDPQRMRARKRYIFIGVPLIFVSMVVLALISFVLRPVAGWPFLIALSLFLVGLATVVQGALFSPLSERGAELSAQWQGFSAYLKDVTRGREPAYDPRTFERYLPYAAGFGLAGQWAKALSKQAGAEIPAWFGALTMVPEDSMDAFVTMSVALHASGGSSSDGGSSGGGGGAGGGGSSGAG